MIGGNEQARTKLEHAVNRCNCENLNETVAEVPIQDRRGRMRWKEKEVGNEKNPSETQSEERTAKKATERNRNKT